MRSYARRLLCVPLLGTAACAADAVAGPRPAPGPEAAAAALAAPQPRADAEAAEPRQPVVSWRCPGSISVRTGEPLYIIDGVPVMSGDPLAGLDPDDIQSIEVLKGASASALYGTRAADGVIVILTRAWAARHAPSRRR